MLLNLFLTSLVHGVLFVFVFMLCTVLVILVLGFKGAQYANSLTLLTSMNLYSLEFKDRSTTYRTNLIQVRSFKEFVPCYFLFTKIRSLPLPVNVGSTLLVNHIFYLLIPDNYVG